MTETFTQTSNMPYNRYRYKLVYTNQKSVIYEDYLGLIISGTPVFVRGGIIVGMPIRTGQT